MRTQTAAKGRSDADASSMNEKRVFRMGGILECRDEKRATAPID